MLVLLIRPAGSDAALNYAECVNSPTIHCYAQTIWDMSPYPDESVQGAATYVNANGGGNVNVPGFANGYDRVNEPLWVAFVFPGVNPITTFLEEGQYAGSDLRNDNSLWPIPPAGDCCTIHYYLDRELPGSYEEIDFPIGPAPGETHLYEMLSAGGSSWCQYFDGSQAYCWPGFPASANQLQDGLELHVSSGQGPYVTQGITVGYALYNNAWHAWGSTSNGNSHGKLIISPPAAGLCLKQITNPGYSYGSIFYGTTFNAGYC